MRAANNQSRVFLFSLYTAVIWAMAFAWRRSWRGVAAVLGGVLGLYLIRLGLNSLPGTEGRVPMPMIEILIWPFMALILVSGLYIVSLGKSQPDFHCRRCGYDMRPAGPGKTCPECGTIDAMVRPRVRGNGRSRVVRAPRLAAQPPHQHAQQQDPQGHPGDERPPEQRERAVGDGDDEGDAPGGRRGADQPVLAGEPSHR